MTNDSESMPDEDLIELFGSHLDGCSLAYIHDNKLSGYSRRRLRRALDAGVPEHLRCHPDLASERWMWICITKDYQGTDPGKTWRLVILRYDRPITQTLFRKTVKALETTLRADYDAQLSEGFVGEALDDRKHALRLIHKGVRAWEGDAEGNVRRVDHGISV